MRLVAVKEAAAHNGRPYFTETRDAGSYAFPREGMVAHPVSRFQSICCKSLTYAFVIDGGGSHV